MSPSRDQIIEAVLAFITADTWAESKQLVEAHRDVLLTDAADSVLADLLEQYKDNEDVTRILEEHRTLLARCRHEGIDAAFSDRLHSPMALHESELSTLLGGLQQLTEPSDMPRAVAMYQTALELVSRDEQPELWATLQSNLGNSLYQNPLGDRAQNLERATYHFQQALEVYTRQTFPQQWAAAHNDLGKAYRRRIRGEWAENLERATYHFQQALEVRTREDFPAEWAMTQNNLATAYADRIRGERAENLERAIYHYERAFEVRTREDFPAEWAMTQYNLANAYVDRIRGERAENLERAIYHYEYALEVRTRQDFPEDWAMTWNNLGEAYRRRIRGERAQNLEEAILHYELALEVYTREAFPENWAMIQNNLATAYADRIRGDWAQNLEQAIYHYERALEVRTREAFPADWAVTQYNLANAYADRIRGDRAQNLEQAIYHYERALEVRTRLTLPEQWAATQNNLGEAYRRRIRGDRAENLEQAISHCQQALEVYTREAFPEQWAMTQNNLAVAYVDRIRGDRAQNLERAIHHYERAFEVRRLEDFPVEWAMTQSNLANAYQDRIWGDRAENFEQAIHHYQLALEIRTPTAFPQDCRTTAYALGDLLYDERRFAEARTAFTTAHEAIEALRGEIQREGARRDLAEQNANLYARLVHCCLLEGDEEAAFAYAAAAKGRAFVDLLATARFDLSAAGADDPELAEDLRKAQELRRQIDDLLTRLSSNGDPSTPDGAEHRSPREMVVYLRTLQDQEAALWDDMAYEYPALTATQQAPAFAADEARALAGDLGATLVEYYRHADGWCAFVATPDEVRHVSLPDVNDDLLRRMLRWIVRVELPAGRGDVSYRLLHRLHEALIAPLLSHLPPGGPVVLAPFSWLHLVPLGAALDRNTGRYATEDYRLTFAPSLAALRVVSDQARRDSAFIDEQKSERLLNVAYPGVAESRLYSLDILPEAEAIARHFTEVTPLYQDAATPDAVLAHARGKDVVHLSCHGWFNPEAPEQSGLILSGGWLTVQRIITELRLDQTRLVTLSAPLSGRVEVRPGEEHVGLLQAMMSAGAQAVVASLWMVHDAATRALFEAFYTGIAAGNSPADALADAARLVRSRPGWEHPYYWAAFQVSGLAHYAEEPTLLPADLAARIAGIQKTVQTSLTPRELKEALRSFGAVESQPIQAFQEASQGGVTSAESEHKFKNMPGSSNIMPDYSQKFDQILPE